MSFLCLVPAHHGQRPLTLCSVFRPTLYQLLKTIEHDVIYCLPSYVSYFTHSTNAAIISNMLKAFHLAISLGTEAM